MVKKIPLTIRRVTAVVCFMALLTAVLVKTSDLFERKYSDSKYYDFYKQEQDFDVLFLGTSHVLNAVYPMELWRDYGIVSYNMANHSENICTNYWQLRNALDHTSPKVVVVDLYAIDGDSKVNEQYLHNFADAMPFSMTKIEMVNDLLEPSKRMEYLFNFSLYHSRWEELGAEDMRPSTGLEKGAELREEIAVNESPVLIPKDEYDATDRLNKQYLQKIIDLCNEKGIQVVLMYVPYTMPESHQKAANWGYVCAQENQIPYLNFVYEELAINYATDCADIAHHLNSSGARKVTDYLGSFLTENYELSDRRNDDAYSFWNQDYEEYRNMKSEWIDTIDSLYSYLVLLNDKDYRTTVYLTNDSYIYENPELMALFENVSVFGSLEYVTEYSEEITDDVIKLEVTDTATGSIVSTRLFDQGSVEQTELITYKDNQ